MVREKINYAFAGTPFGEVLVAATEKGVCGLYFIDAGIEGKSNGKGALGTRDEALAELKKLIPNAILAESMTPLLKKAANFEDIPLDLRGTPFQIAVWHALLEIPRGELSTYSEIAQKVGRPGACRATGTAVGSNPVSVIVPCHRVVRRGGGLGGYRWGLARKKAILNWESKK